VDARDKPGHDDLAAVEGKHMTASTDFKPAAIKPTISPADLDKLDIRLGTIELVEDVPASEKLLRLRVDFGDHKRTILVGMKKERNNPKSEVKGRQALFVVNLPSRKMAGEESEGMLFDIGYADGLLPALAVPERPLPNGCRAG
jgi:tRNA-binding protein